jgi:hypothetical protein
MIGPVGATGNENVGLVYLGVYAGGNDYVVTVSAYDDSVVAAMPVGDGPCGLAYSGRNNHLYCVATYSSRMVVLTGDGTRVLKTLSVGFYPEVMALVPRHGRIYVGHANTSFVYVCKDPSLVVAEPLSPRSGLSEAISVTPSPFSRTAAFTWRLPARGGEVVRLYAQDGRLVREARVPAGQSRWVWDGRDDSGVPLPPGVYVLESGPGVRAKVVKLR